MGDGGGRGLSAATLSCLLPCSCNSLRVGPGDGWEGGIPACVHPLLWATLRDSWNASAFVQGDNEA